jgi:hypothetical protein
MKVVSCIGIAACALAAAACGHQGVSERQVRAAVLRFVKAPPERVQIVAGPSCEKNERANDWRCRVAVRVPDNTDAPTVHGVNRSLITSCVAKRCEVIGAKSAEYGPSNVRWKAVINDWYHGGINHQHSCAAVQAAISHLPTTGITYGTVREDLSAYERKVC